MSVSFPIAICLLNGNYPSDYWNLQGVTDIKAPSELWWSSRERRQFESGAQTSEYLELDMGRVRSFNFLNFSILQKPIDIFIEYDVWGYDSGIKNWASVTRLAGERFDDRVDYLSTQANPWKDCQFYFTNRKGDMLSTRYLRLRFERRDQVWPNATISGTFPWSIDLKDLRTARYAVTLNDARGLLTNQGKVVSRIVDPVRSVDDAIVTMVYEDPDSLDGATVEVEGIPSDPGDEFTPRPVVGHDGETYFGIMVSNDSCGIYSAAAGTGGMTATANGNGQLSGTHNNNGTHFVGPTEITVTEYTDSNEVSHTLSDLPGFGAGWAFFFPHPYDTETFAWMIAMGTAATAGLNTTALTDYARNINGAASTVVSSNNFSPPAVGTVMTYAIIVGNSETITDDSLLLADDWVLQVTDDAGLADHGFTLYFYTKVADGGEGGSYNYPSVTLSATTKWATTYSYLASPSDPTGTCYLIDSGDVVDVGSVGGSPGLTFTSTIHG